VAKVIESNWPEVSSMKLTVAVLSLCSCINAQLVCKNSTILNQWLVLVMCLMLLSVMGDLIVFALDEVKQLKQLL